jgi:hypothetical protein
MLVWTSVAGAPIMLTYDETLWNTSPPRVSAVSAVWLAPSKNTHADTAVACVSAEATTHIRSIQLVRAEPRGAIPVSMRDTKILTSDGLDDLPDAAVPLPHDHSPADMAHKQHAARCIERQG